MPRIIHRHGVTPTAPANIVAPRISFLRAALLKRSRYPDKARSPFMTLKHNERWIMTCEALAVFHSRAERNSSSPINFASDQPKIIVHGPTFAIG